MSSGRGETPHPHRPKANPSPFHPGTVVTSPTAKDPQSVPPVYQPPYRAAIHLHPSPTSEGTPDTTGNGAVLVLQNLKPARTPLAASAHLPILSRLFGTRKPLRSNHITHPRMSRSVTNVPSRPQSGIERCLVADPSESVTVGTQELRDDLKRILHKYVVVFNGKAFSGWTNPSGLPLLGTKWDGPATAPTTSPQ